MSASFMTFMATSALVIMTPGPDTFLVVRSTTAGGRVAGLASSLGIALGQLVWASATSLGLVAMLMASQSMFHAVRVFGALYLIWLGVRGLARAIVPGPRPGVPAARDSPLRLSRLRALRDGLVSNLGNPKMAVFFSSVLPLFVAKSEKVLLSMILLGVLFALMTCAWLSLYALVVTRLENSSSGKRVRRAVEGVSGSVLIFFGLELATSRR
jgi:threonine/homoserine/homoserine lactone efflux protein